MGTEKSMRRAGLIAIGALVVALVLGMCIVPATAYFTATTKASGEMTIAVKSTTHITEEYDKGVKHVFIYNDEDSLEDVVVRAKVFYPRPLTCMISGTNWMGPAAEGWYLYGKVVHPGKSAEELMVQISGLEEMFPSGSNPQESDYGTNFNVVVVYEALPASQATVDGDYVIEFPAGWE